MGMEITDREFLLLFSVLPSLCCLFHTLNSQTSHFLFPVVYMALGFLIPAFTCLSPYLRPSVKSSLLLTSASKIEPMKALDSRFTERSKATPGVTAAISSTAGLTPLDR